MRRFLITAALALAVGWPAQSWPQEGAEEPRPEDLRPAAQDSTPKPEHVRPGPDVMARIREYERALRDRDLEALDGFWAREYVFVDPSGRVVSRTERLASVRDGTSALDTLELTGNVVKVYSDVALQRADLKLAGRYGGEPQSGEFRVLVVWVKREGQWKQVAAQLTPITAR